MVVNKTTGVIGMLLEFRCSNHKSIKNEITFSMLAGSDDTHEKSLKLHNGMRILRTAVIYGPNGSGKSNFIDALNFCALMVDKSMRFQPGEKVPQSEHKTSEEGDASSYAIQFFKKKGSAMHMDLLFRTRRSRRNICTTSQRAAR